MTIVTTVPQEPLTPMLRVGKVLEPKMNFRHRFIPNYGELKEVVAALRSMGKRIVLTKGVYDLIHVGHARYISQAKAEGDILIVSIDTDALTRKRKGPTRPIVSEDERVEMILHLRYVDIVTIRDTHHGEEDDIEVIRPDVLITSETTADYTEEKKVFLRDKYGLTVHTLKPQAETSTTATIRNLMIDGRAELIAKLQAVLDEFNSHLQGL